MLRVLIADLPELQAGVIAALVEAEPDMLVVGHESSPGGLAESVAHLEPDVLVISRPLARRDVRELVTSRPGLSVVAIDEVSGTIAHVAFVRDDRSWPEQVIAGIRAAGGRGDPAPQPDRREP